MSEELRGEAHKEAERQTPFNGWENAMENAALQHKFIDGANWQAARDAEKNAKLEAVLALHKPGRHVVAPIWGDGRYCLECNNWAETEPVYEWPCATVRAIEEAGA